jgi:hypothetical protein
LKQVLLSGDVCPPTNEYVYGALVLGYLALLQPTSIFIVPSSCWLVREVFLRRKSQTVVVLMSATMDLQELMACFSRNGPSISIGSSAYAVQVYFLDDISSIIGDTDEVEMLSSH